MKKIFCFFALLILPVSIFAQPFAAKIDPPKNPTNDPEIALAIQILKGVEVPDTKDVGVSAYPAARIFQTTIAQSGMLPTVRLLSTDEVSVVKDYYKNELSDWELKDLYGVFTFFRGDEMKAMMMQIPVIQIQNADFFKKTMPSAKTVITIGYKSPE
jgi:hypothetical protein